MFEFELQTPDGSLLDILRNAHDLLSQCDIELPEVDPLTYFVVMLPNLLPLHVSYH